MLVTPRRNLVQRAINRAGRRFGIVPFPVAFESGRGCELTDVDPSTVAIGQRVEMTFRRLFTAEGVHNYFWKAKPIASASEVSA